MPTLAEYVQDPPALVGPDYNIYRYTNDVYKVVHFKTPRSLVPKPRTPKKAEPSEKKSESALSRARRNVMELGLCNDWKYFCTFTLDKEKYDRHNLSDFKADFTQWIRDQRKKYKKLGIELDAKFLLVPELHQDGAWHIHGLLGDITPVLVSFAEERVNGMKIPDKLVDGGYFNWPGYMKKFGFCSLGIIRDRVATGFYVSKYITKSLSETNEALGVHTYIPSRGLNRAELYGGVYGACSILDSCLVNKYEWVETGMATPADGIEWDWAMVPFGDKSQVQMLDFASAPEKTERYFEAFYEGVQQALEGF